MKKAFFVFLMTVSALFAAFAEGDLPRLAVVAFNINDTGNTKLVRDAVAIRNSVQTNLVATGKYEVIARDEIDKLLENQKIAVSSISSRENLQKLQLQNINYLITGTVDALDTDYAVSISILDVATGKFSHSTDQFMGSGSQDVYNGVKTLVAQFLAGMITDETGSIAQTSGSGGQARSNKQAASHLERGKAFFDRGELDMALDEFTEAIRLDPNYANAYARRGRTKAGKGDYDSAITDCNQAIRLDLNDAYAYFARGYTYGGKKDNDRAIADYTQAIKLDPNYVVAYNNRGSGYRAKGDYDRAIADFTQAIKLDPNFALAYRNRGSAYFDKKDYDKAIADYNEAIRLNPNDSWAYLYRGLLYAHKDDYTRGISDLTQAIKLGYNEAIVYQARAVCYHFNSEYDKAVADYTQAIKLDPKLRSELSNNLELARQRKK